MNKTAIKNFAVWARNKLIDDITYKAGLIGVNEKGIAQPLPQSSKDLQFFDIGTKDYAQLAGKGIEQRNALIRVIRAKEADSDYATAFKSVVEEVAYTWFNRLIAIRFMEVNDYLPSRIRVLSSENPAKSEPDFVTTPFDTDMEFTTEEQDKIMQLKDENKLNELFRMIFIKQCNKLYEILPELFEETNNYTELLLSISFTDRDGVVYHLVHDIDEDDFNVEKEGQVEIIGWMYQYYNIEPKDETFALLKKNIKITKERIPAATQLFTPDWIVRYMVENSLGRLWVEGHPNDSLKENWKYYLEEAEQEADVLTKLEQIRAEYRNLNPEDIKVIDPCMGSGHILVYCFDVLMQIYESQGYTQRDAAQSILENNLFGLDIDKRAAQLAYFAVMMKARQYDRRIFGREIKPHVYATEESNDINRSHLKYFGASFIGNTKKQVLLQTENLLNEMKDAEEFGSTLIVQNYDWDVLYKFINDVDTTGQITMETVGIEETQRKVFNIVKIAQIIASKYHLVITNPPYMGRKSINDKLSQHLEAYYPEGKADLYTSFIQRCSSMTRKRGFTAMITVHTWLFISSYEALRKNVLSGNVISSMIHTGASTFEEINSFNVLATAFVLIKACGFDRYNGNYIRLVDYRTTEEKVENYFNKQNCFSVNKEAFFNIPGTPFVYWISNNARNNFIIAKPISQYAQARVGLQTGNNDRFVRYWYEVDIDKICFTATSCDNSAKSGLKWFPYNKGGNFRKWYGMNEYVVDWYNDGFQIRNYVENGKLKSRPQNTRFYFKKGITWSLFGFENFGIRYKDEGFVFDVSGSSMFPEENIMIYILAFLASKVAFMYLSVLAPTVNFQAGNIEDLPLIVDENRKKEIERLALECINISKDDWDDFEESWNFKVHPLVKYNARSLREAYASWHDFANKRYLRLKENEERINDIFIDIYNIKEDVSSEVIDRDIAIRKPVLDRDVRSLLSYAVGCIFGRYSLDNPGLIYAGGQWNERQYTTFRPDVDNCILISDEEYSSDDIVGRIVEWLSIIYGSESLEDNLIFIAEALGNKGATSREVIRNYFLTDFIKDHIKTYQKRPIYWLFDSGKQNGFKALVYMHRWKADTVGNLRVEYLHKMQHTYEREIVRMQETIDNSRDSREVSKATKRKDKLQKQLKETKDYDAKLAHIALSRIDIDLDDGVKVNYEKVQTGRDGKKMQILAKI